VLKNFVSRTEEAPEYWRKLHDVKLHDMCSSVSVKWMNKSRRIRRAERVAHTGGGGGVKKILGFG
jgi:hypothetical protein